MAKRIIWSANAKQDKIDILKYWLQRNKSKVYPRKLDKLIREAVKTLSEGVSS